MLQSLVYLLCPLMMLACMANFVRPRVRNATREPSGAHVSHTVRPLTRDATPATVRPLSRLADWASLIPREELARLWVAKDELGRRIEILAAQLGEPSDDARLRPVAGRSDQ